MCLDKSQAISVRKHSHAMPSKWDITRNMSSVCHCETIIELDLKGPSCVERDRQMWFSSCRPSSLLFHFQFTRLIVPFKSYVSRGLCLLRHLANQKLRLDQAQEKILQRRDVDNRKYGRWLKALRGTASSSLHSRKCKNQSHRYTVPLLSIVFCVGVEYAANVEWSDLELFYPEDHLGEPHTSLCQNLPTC